MDPAPATFRARCYVRRRFAHCRTRTRCSSSAWRLGAGALRDVGTRRSSLTYVLTQSSTASTAAGPSSRNEPQNCSCGGAGRVSLTWPSSRTGGSAAAKLMPSNVSTTAQQRWRRIASPAKITTTTATDHHVYPSGPQHLSYLGRGTHQDHALSTSPDQCSGGSQQRCCPFIMTPAQLATVMAVDG